MLKLKLQYFGHLMQRIDSLEKTLMLGKIERQEEKGTTEDEMVGWHHWFNGHGFWWTTGVGDGQGGLACCGSWGLKESDMTERLNWTELKKQGFPGSAGVKNPLANAGNTSLIPGSGRSPAVQYGNPLQYSCLGNPMDRGAWWATIHRAANSQIWLSN